MQRESHVPQQESTHVYDMFQGRDREWSTERGFGG